MSDVFTLLARELGDEKVLRAPERLEDYGRDESGLGPFPPDCAVLCASADEVALVLRLAAEHRIPVTPRERNLGQSVRMYVPYRTLNSVNLDQNVPQGHKNCNLVLLCTPLCNLHSHQKKSHKGY
jgi:hypothetical protein